MLNTEFRKRVEVFLASVFAHELPDLLGCSDAAISFFMTIELGTCFCYHLDNSFNRLCMRRPIWNSHWFFSNQSDFAGSQITCKRRFRDIFKFVPVDQVSQRFSIKIDLWVYSLSWAPVTKLIIISRSSDP